MIQPKARFRSPPAQSSSICGPATPDSPCESPGLGSSDFARHYSRNHGCFLFLRVLRWFTSPGSLRAPMDSAHDTECSHSVGSPIRTSPDHSVLTAPRSFSQLATSFFAFLCLGIPTHALSSLTIKFPNGCPRPYPSCKLALTRRTRLARTSLRLPCDCRPIGNFISFPIHIGLVSNFSERTPIPFPSGFPSRPETGRPCSLLPVILQLSKISPARNASASLACAEK